jgi:hypothetical protein
VPQLPRHSTPPPHRITPRRGRRAVSKPSRAGQADSGGLPVRERGLIPLHAHTIERAEPQPAQRHQQARQNGTRCQERDADDDRRQRDPRLRRNLRRRRLPDPQRRLRRQAHPVVGQALDIRRRTLRALHANPRNAQVNAGMVGSTARRDKGYWRVCEAGHRPAGARASPATNGTAQ